MTGDLPAQLRGYLLRVNDLGLVDRHGWAVQHTHGNARFAPFSYTVGLAESGHPELVVLGLPPTVAQSLLNTLRERVRARTRLAAGHRVDHVRGYVCALIAVAGSRLLTVANASYRGDGPPVAALQLVRPDPAGSAAAARRPCALTAPARTGRPFPSLHPFGGPFHARCRPLPRHRGRARRRVPRTA